MKIIHENGNQKYLWQQAEKPTTLIFATSRDNFYDFANTPFLFNSVGFLQGFVPDFCDTERLWFSLPLSKLYTNTYTV